MTVTVERIMPVGYELENPEFAYLSACRTTVGDGELHLVSAMQFTGSRSPVTCVWDVGGGRRTGEQDYVPVL